MTPDTGNSENWVGWTWGGCTKTDTSGTGLRSSLLHSAPPDGVGDPFVTRARGRKRASGGNMLQSLQRRRDEEGFTLIELMVVVLIIAILVAIAIPTFLGARQRAQDKAAQSSLRNSLTAAKTLYTDAEDYTDATVAALGDVEPSLTFVATGVASTGPKEVSVDATSASVIHMAALSNSGTCFYIMDDVSSTGSGTEYATGTTCTGTAAAGATYGPAW
jgi:type IV pilus assembly protein PilA